MIATVYGVFKDFYSDYIDLTYGNYSNDEEFKAAVQASVPKFEPNFKKINGLLGKKEFIAGELTWVDFMIADFIQTIRILSKEHLKDNEYLKSFPMLV